MGTKQRSQHAVCGGRRVAGWTTVVHTYATIIPHRFLVRTYVICTVISVHAHFHASIYIMCICFSVHILCARVRILYRRARMCMQKRLLPLLFLYCCSCCCIIRRRCRRHLIVAYPIIQRQALMCKPVRIYGLYIHIDSCGHIRGA